MTGSKTGGRSITHEEIVREFHDLCLARSKTCRRIYERLKCNCKDVSQSRALSGKARDYDLRCE